MSSVMVAGLAGCASVPMSGPTGPQIAKDMVTQTQAGDIRVVEMDSTAKLPKATEANATPFVNRLPPPTDMIGPGDVLDVTVYEAGVTLFGSSSITSINGVSITDPSAKAQLLSPIRVDDDGYIVLPYAGKLKVAGLIVEEVEKLIRKSLRGYSQNPQIMVNIKVPITNTIIVGGEVERPGRLFLQTNRESITDVLALSGGFRGNSKDLEVRLTRRGRTADFRLSDLLGDNANDPQVYPGDRLQVVSEPYSYSVMGAAGKVALLPFSTPDVSLAEAISQAGGSSPEFGDPAAIFVFRMVPGEEGKPQAVVYHFNMMHVDSYFLAQEFQIRDKDVVYFGNARANQPAKVLQLVSQLFAPLITVISAAQILKL